MSFPSIVLAVLSSTAAPALHAPADTVLAELVTRVDGHLSASVFGRIEALEVGSDGAFYVLDGVAHRLTAFASDGTERWAVGQEGEGPGEFNAPVGLTWSPKGSLWVIDPESQRATAYDTEGRLQDTHHLPAGFTLSPWPGRFDRTGRLYSYLAAPDDSYGFVLGRYDSNLRRIDVVPTPRAPEPEQFFEGRSDRGSHLRARVPFTPSHVWRLDSHGEFVSMWTGDVRFLRGGESLSGARPPDVPVVAVTRSDRSAALDALSRFTRMGGRVEPDRIPRVKPPVKTFVLDDSDRIWALMSHGHGTGRSVWEVFDPRGRHLDTVVAPVGSVTVPVPIIRSGYMVAVERDEFGIESVVLVRLPTIPS